MILSFQLIKNLFHIADSSFLTYAQISSAIHKKCKEGAAPASCPDWDVLLRKATLLKGTVSNIYSSLFGSARHAYAPVQLAWEHDLNTSLTSSQWNDIWRSALYTSKCVRFSTVQETVQNFMQSLHHPS